MRFVVVFLLWVSPVWASISFPKYTQLDSHIGPLIVKQMDKYTQQVFINGQPVRGMDAKTISLHGIYTHSADNSQTVLLSMRHGGNGCFDDWIALRIVGNRILPGAAFGGCGHTAIALRSDAQGLELDMPSNDLTHLFTTYRFSGAVFTSTARLRNDTSVPPAAAGNDTTRWVGTNPTEILNDATERRRFRTVMGDEFMNNLKNSVSVSTGIIQDSGYIYGAGCWPHICNATAGVWALRISDGAVFAAIWRKGQPAQIAGGAFNTLPARLRVFALTGQF